MEGEIVSVNGGGDFGASGALDEGRRIGVGGGKVEPVDDGPPAGHGFEQHVCPALAARRQDQRVHRAVDIAQRCVLDAAEETAPAAPKAKKKAAKAETADKADTAKEEKAKAPAKKKAAKAAAKE